MPSSSSKSIAIEALHMIKVHLDSPSSEALRLGGPKKAKKGKMIKKKLGTLER